MKSILLKNKQIKDFKKKTGVATIKSNIRIIVVYTNQSKKAKRTQQTCKNDFNHALS